MSTLIQTRGLRSSLGIELLVIEPARLAVIPLVSGTLVLGRGGGEKSVDVRLDDGRASKVHAILEVSPDGIDIVDQGSRNGTFVLEEHLEPFVKRRLEWDVTVRIGDSLLMVRRAPPAAQRVTRCDHVYFLARLAEACGRKRGEHAARFAVVRVKLGARGSDIAGLADLIADAGILGDYAPGHYELLLPLSGAEAASDVERRVRAALGEQDAACGVAVSGVDGNLPDQLLAVAADRLFRVGEEAGGAVVASPELRHVYSQARKVAGSATRTVFILGESGVGKDVLARYIHAQSSRAAGPFVAGNCATLTTGTGAAELFGYERGAFTGAVAAHAGWFEQANGGTLFLDEVAELNLELQSTLLRALENGEVRRAGGTKTIRVDVRVIAATNADIATAVRDKGFRQDLYYRLATFTLAVPALRDHPATILPLAKRMIQQFAGLNQRPPLAMSEEAQHLLETYSWPGNIRELRNVIERAVVMAESDCIESEDLDFTEVVASGTARSPSGDRKWEDMAPAELRQTLIDTLIDHDFIKTQAAKALGVSRERFLALMDIAKLKRTRRSGTP